MEYPSLPPVEVLASDFSQIRKFSDDALRAKMDIYSNILKRRYNGDNHNGKKWLAKLLADKDHWSAMSREAMESALVIEYMKAVIGKTPAADIEKLLGFKTVKQQSHDQRIRRDRYQRYARTVSSRGTLAGK
jgi:hypothetical protein